MIMGANNDSKTRKDIDDMVAFEMKMAKVSEIILHCM